MLYSLHIGTNNLGIGSMAPTSAAKGVLAVVNLLLSATCGRISVTALLPRGSLLQRKKKAETGELAAMKMLPLQSVLSTRTDLAHAAIHEVNTQVAAGVALLDQRRVRFSRCGGRFERYMNGSSGSWRIDSRMLPDGLHPSTAGYAHLLDCWASALASIDPMPDPSRGERRPSVTAESSKIETSCRTWGAPPCPVGTMPEL